MTVDLENLQQWIGNQQTKTDRLSLTPITGLAATLNRDLNSIAPGVDLPALWHWLFFLEQAPQSQVAADGHAQKGNFLPAVPLPRRMWAGSRFKFHHPLLIDQQVQRVSTIKSIDAKQGKSGDLVFVCVQHELSNDAGVAIEEEHDIVYRSNPPLADISQPLAEGKPAPQARSFSKEINPDPVLLFRYSALTFNGHRIHYDRNYVTEVEGYPGLIVHGPLLASLLVELLHDYQPDSRLKEFEFKAIRPVFDLNKFSVCGHASSDGEFDLWVEDHDGFLCMKAHAKVENIN